MFLRSDQLEKHVSQKKSLQDYDVRVFLHMCNGRTGDDWAYYYATSTILLLPLPPHTHIHTQVTVVTVNLLHGSKF